MGGSVCLGGGKKGLRESYSPYNSANNNNNDDNSDDNTKFCREKGVDSVVGNKEVELGRGEERSLG